MATRGERQALLFLTAVVLLGAGTRACRARRDAVPSADLDRQIGAVEAFGTGAPGPRASLPRKRGRGPTRADSVDSSAPRTAGQPAAIRVDLDVASPSDIERLPGVGPAIAKRIVANRTANGAFGCLSALDSVKGIGRALLTKLDSLVTFGGVPRPACGQR